jgi:hypothetical protein
MPDLKSLKKKLRWNSKNMGRMLLHRFDPPVDPDLREMAETLRRDGIVTCDVRVLLGPQAPLFESMREKILAAWQSDMAKERAAALSGEKNFKVKLLERELAFDSAALQISLHPRVVQLVNSYMGMRSYLRDVDLWWDRPTPNAAAATQLWHRDFDDARCIKGFIYFNDVDEQTGPFTYLPGTHMFGRYANQQPGGSTKNRFTDEEMVAPLSPKEAMVVTGSAGTMILCDTYGFHRGVKPQKDRLMSLFQYVSKASKYPRQFETVGECRGLNVAQRNALDPLPYQMLQN